MTDEDVEPRPSGQLFTYQVLCTFRLQHTFTADEVVPDPGGDENDVEPTKTAFRRLAEEIAEALGATHSVSDVEVHAESDDLLGSGD